MIRIFSVGIRSIPNLEVFLGSKVSFGLAAEGNQPVAAVAGWGYRTSARKAMRYARKAAVPYLALEDGFLRSVGLGNSDPPLSIVVDELGIYYDANRSSRLESLIGQELSPLQLKRATELISLWRKERVSKYNHQREAAQPIIPPSAKLLCWTNHGADVEAFPPGEYVLVVDQTRGDASIRYGQAGPESFQHMLNAALSEHPQRTVVLKVHPDVCAGKKRGHFNLVELARHPRIKIVSDNVHPVGLIEHASSVYTVTSQVGFEALLWGRPVRTFGMPFYAGWGLTNDELPSPVRRTHCSLQQLVHAALIDYPRYVHPETGCRCEVEDILSYIGLQRRMRERFPPHVHASGLSPYKRRVLRRFLSGSTVHVLPRKRQPPAGSTVAVWGGDDKGFNRHRRSGESVSTNTDVIHLEDGFLRSVGLGADLIRPVSWVIDRRGLYYDASRPSDLECLLQSAMFDAGLCERAGRLRRRIVVEGLTKYNVGKRGWEPPASRAHDVGNEAHRGAHRVILVPGQVETDASIRYGASDIRSNIGLLHAVRKAHPHDYIVYKPHPDVVTGLRSRGEGEKDACSYCDEVVTDISMHELLGKVDEVHVLTSLSGFEALLRGKPVTTYGQPFYAGWGLTRDLALTNEVVQRRTRKLGLDELVAGALILYPTYVSRITGRYTTPERVLDELLIWRDCSHQGLPWWRWPLRWALQAWGSFR